MEKRPLWSWANDSGDFHKLGCDFFYKLTNRDTGKEVARARTGLIFFDYEKQKMVLMPEKFKKIRDS